MMQSTATSPQEYIDSVPEDKKQAMIELRHVIRKNLPEGFTEIMSYGMIGYVVPHSLYPKGYHCDPKLPLGMMSIAAQKTGISVHHIGLYGDKNLFKWFTDEYGRYSKTKPDMGKGCIKFKKPGQIPFQLMGELAAKLTPQEWIEKYESMLKKQ